MSARSPARRIIPFDEFPALHRVLWEKGMTERDRYGGLPYGATLSPYTERYARHTWGRVLMICPENERSLVPTKLIVPPLIRHLVTELERAGNCGNTIAARLWGLRTALGIMCPEGDFRWITSPDGHDVRSVFHSERRPIRIYHPLLLYRWGIQLMEQALQMNNPITRAIKYRNGLLIAVLAARAPRLRSLAAIRVGIQLVRHDDRFGFVFGKQDLKWRASLEYDLTARLTHHIEHYLAVERPTLLTGSDHGWLWVGKDGARLAEGGIYTMLIRETRKHFGEAFGPHRFRHAAGTLAPISDPKRPGAVAAMLGNSNAVLQKAYNLGRQQDAAHQFQSSFLDERRRLEGIALRAFGRGRPAATPDAVTDP